MKYLIIILLALTTSCGQVKQTVKAVATEVVTATKAVAWEVAKAKIKAEMPQVIAALTLLKQTDESFVTEYTTKKDGKDVLMMAVINRLTLKVVSEVVVK